MNHSDFVWYLADLRRVMTGTERKMLAAMRRWVNEHLDCRYIACSYACVEVWEDVQRRAGFVPWAGRTYGGTIFKGRELVALPDMRWMAPITTLYEAQREGGADAK